MKRCRNMTGVTRRVMNIRRVCTLGLCLLSACGTDASQLAPDGGREDASVVTDGSMTDAAITGDATPTTPDSGQPAGFVAVPSFGTNPGGLKMYLHLPPKLASGAPVVLALHGCTQTANDYAAAGWSELGDLFGFAVVYPEQQAANNSSRCFRWFDSAHTARGMGESESLRQMAAFMTTAHGTTAFYATGLSAGGGMTAALLAAYPDVFKSGAIMAGTPYGCASSVLEGLTCANPGSDKTASAWGALVRNAYPGYAGKYPTVSIWQGTSDKVVHPSNMTQLARQWTDANGIDAVADATSTVLGATHVEYKDGAGAVRVETYSIPNMAHGAALSPGLAAAGGCGVAGPYMIDASICSTYYAARFFGLVP